MNTMDVGLEIGFDTSTLRSVFGTFPTGVVAVAAHVDGVPTGFAASSFVSVSLDPPLVSFCVQNTSATWALLKNCRSLGISVLGETHEAVARALAGRAENRFTDLAVSSGHGGPIFVDGASAWLEVSVEELIPAGDHTIALMRVDGVASHDREPIVFHRSVFRRLKRSS
ncbi:MAG: flavin reductase family protein [Rhodococcus sp.]|jgi:flavin reductase (DIM6/NTAB) family NADH-FMN oxidoreductase RutF|nr:flavin reductase family protein [Rhodococcus sp. (in: high G+C Gram-positive bacteria)]